MRKFAKMGLCVGLSICILVAFCACADSDPVFTRAENGNFVSEEGVEYAYLTHEGVLAYFGELTFQGYVKGERKTTKHLGVSFQTGMFSPENDEAQNVLIRHLPNNEWSSIYRKASLPPLDFSIENCIRLELVLEGWSACRDVKHTTCGVGIRDKEEIAEFLADVRAQKDPVEAGLYELVRLPDGRLENCVYYEIYGFFEEEANLALLLQAKSFNGLAYSISLDGKDYVLPDKWVQKLLAA